MESCKITDSSNLCQQLANFGTVTIKGSIITVTNDKLYDKSYKDILGSWRKSVHAFIGNMTDGSWISERRSTRMIAGDTCRHCRKELGKYQDADCKCYPNMGFPDLGCNCYYGFNSKKGHGYCEANSENYTCRPFYIRVFNAVYVYKTNSTVPKLPLHQRVRNETNHLFKIAHVLLLANTFCTIDKHTNSGCVFATVKLQKEILYRIISLSFKGDKKVRDKFKWMLKRRDISKIC